MAEKATKKKIGEQRKQAARKQKQRKEKFQAAIKRQEEVLERAEQLTQTILKGKRFRERMVVRLRDGSQYKVTVRPLDEGEISEIAEHNGVPIDKISTLKGGKNSKAVKILRDFGIKALQTEGQHFDSKVLREKLAFGELLKVGARAIEVSRLGSVEVAGLESFRRQPAG